MNGAAVRLGGAGGLDGVGSLGGEEGGVAAFRGPGDAAVAAVDGGMRTAWAGAGVANPEGGGGGRRGGCGGEDY